MKTLIVTCFVALLAISNVAAQTFDLANALKEKKLVPVGGSRVVSGSDESKHSVSILGTAWLKGVEFTEGTIELDIRGNDQMQATFPGIIFHGVDSSTFDGVYFRPFNFQSADAVRKTHAVQYVSVPQFTWKVLRDTRNGQYEKAVTPAPGPNDWFHAKIVVKGKDINVYVNGSSTPSLTVKKLNDRTSGKFGFMCDGSERPGDFANLVIRK
jgi:hypothetical protein